jgi:hypothetical protein
MTNFLPVVVLGAVAVIAVLAFAGTVAAALFNLGVEGMAGTDHRDVPHPPHSADSHA